MKNDYTADGSQYAAYLADAGAREAKYDDQGGVIFEEKPSPESEYERLKSVLFDMGRHIPEGESIWDWLTDNGFDDLRKAFFEGEAARGRIQSWPYGFAKLNVEQSFDEEFEADPELKEAADAIMAKMANRERELVEIGIDKARAGEDLTAFDSGVPFSLDGEGPRKFWKSVTQGPLIAKSDEYARHIVESIVKNANDWIEHHGNEMPHWLENDTLVDVEFRDGRGQKSYPAKRFYWNLLSQMDTAVIRYRLAEGSIIPKGWRKNNGDTPDLDYDIIVEFVCRSGLHGRHPVIALNWKLNPDRQRHGDIIWYRVTS